MVSSSKKKTSAPQRSVRKTEFETTLDAAFNAKVSPSLIARDGVGDEFLVCFDLSNAVVDIYKTTDRFPMKMTEAIYDVPTTLTLTNNRSAKDVPYAELMEFIEKNSVGRRTYIKRKFMCADFSILIHNRAEAAGIRCGLVSVQYYNGKAHAFNVFISKDKGIIFIDLSTTPMKKYTESQFADDVGRRVKYAMILT